MSWRKRYLRHLRAVVRTPPAPTWEFVDVPVVDGVAELPDYSFVLSTGDILRIPVISPPGWLTVKTYRNDCRR